MQRRRSPNDETTFLLGVGLDSDGHKRVTKGDEFLLVGGSEETHEVMQERAIRLTEELERDGKRLADVRSLDELREFTERAGW